ncbi:MAG: tandem-95 repeat protein, partial [Clostridia bacterium]|nr:tandem-95 repeat protein [Clostridia bacterium]
MSRKFLTAFLAAAIVISTLFAPNINVAKAADITSESDWVAAYPNNNQNDYIEDQQTGSGTVSQDIVGTTSDPSTYMRFSATDVDFRIRLNDIDGAGTDYEFKNFAFIGIDADLDGGIDFFLGIYNPTGNNGRLGIYGAADGYPNISPSTTGIEGKPLMGFEPKDGINYTLTPAGTSIDGDADYFISFKFSLDDIAEALQGTGISFTSSTPFRFMTGTAAQDNSFNQDLNGMDGSGWSSDDTWEDLGVFTDVVSPDGSANYYIVTFDRNTGDTDASPQIKAVEADTALGALPSNPTKRGMYFQEWNTMPDGSGDTIDADTVIHANTTAYAIWSNVPLMTVTFDTGAGTWIDGTTTQLTVNTINGIVDGNMPAEPINGIKNFVGWQIASGEFLNEQTLVENASTYNSTTLNLLVTAVYANGTNLAAFYNNFDATGGDLVAKIYSNGASSNFNGVAPSISRIGYAFDGWYLNDMTCAPTSTNIAAGATINDLGNYYAKWVPVTYDVTFNQNYVGAPADTIQPATDGVVGALPTEPTRTGYEFIEWNRLTDATGEAIYPTTQITEDTTVYAIWKEIINVNFHSEGGTFDGGGTTWSTTAVDDRLALLPQPPALAGATFLGWSATQGGTTPVDLFNTDYDTVRDLYAIWATDYTVRFNENYGTTPATKDVPTAYERVLYIPDDPTRTGYNFVEWTQDPTGGAEFLISTPVIQDEEVYAQWNATPDAVDDAAVTPADTAVVISVLANDTDPEGDTLGISSVTQGANGGTVTIVGTTVSYTPPAGYTGTDTFTYTISDGNGGEDTATVTVYVSVNAPPTAVDDAYTTDEDTALVISDALLGVMANDSDIDGTINLQSNTNPLHGTLALNADGTFTYTPDAGYNGTDSFTYTIVDDDSDTATATVNLTINAVNDTPSAVDDSYSTDQDVTLNVPALTGVLSNDTIGDGLKSIVVATDVAHGTLTLNNDGSFTYVPTPGYFGADEFTYTITDNDDETATATVSLSVHSTAVYSVTYSANGGSNAPTDNTDYQAGETVTIASTEPTYTGYTFAGWTTNFDSNTYDKDDATYYEFTMPAQEVTLTAQWTANTNTAYTVEHYQEDVSGSTYTIVAADTENLTGTTGATATATAKTYTGFTYNAGMGNPSDTILADGSLVLKVYYDRNSHSLGYDSDGGDSTPTGGTYVYGET